MASWLAGVVVLLVSVHSSIEMYGHTLLGVPMIQHLLWAQTPWWVWRYCSPGVRNP